MLRKVPLQNGHYYHIYNRGVEKVRVFRDKNDYLRFLKNLTIFNNNLSYNERDYIKRIKEKGKKPDFWYQKSGFFPLFPLVEIICYCLVPNHYHLILKQLSNDGITRYMRKLGTGYTNYFNAKNKRSGYLFQGKFKSAHIRKEEKLLQLSAYVNGNAEIHKIAKANNWPWSSYLDYIGRRKGKISNKREILNHFRNVRSYIFFCSNFIKEAQKIKKEKDELLE